MTDHTHSELDASGEPLGANMATLGDCGLPPESELLGILRAVAPYQDDFGGVAYVAFDSILGQDYCLPRGVLGVTARNLDVAVRGRLPWEGRGPAIIFGERKIIDSVLSSWQGDQEETKAHIRKKTIAILLHEGAHCLEMPIDRREVDQTILEKQTAAAERKMGRWSRKKFIPPSGPPWAHHGFQFIRILSHLVGRYRLLGGEEFPLDFAFDWRGYELFPLSQYIQALGDEIETLRGDPFATIRATPAPEKYISIFRDSLHWWARFSDDPEAAPLHIAAELAPHIRAGLNDPVGR